MDRKYEILSEVKEIVDEIDINPFKADFCALLVGAALCAAGKMKGGELYYRLILDIALAQFPVASGKELSELLEEYSRDE